MKRIKRPFTLIEIMVCLTILGLASAVVGIQIRHMVADHTFQNNVASLVSELKKCQLIAACDQTDIEVVIAKEGKHLAFWIETDDNLPYFSKRKMLMTGVLRMERNGKEVRREAVHFYPTGRFDEKTIILIHSDEKRYEIGMQHPLIIELKELSA